MSNNKRFCINENQRTQQICSSPVARGEAFYCRRHRRSLPTVLLYKPSQKRRVVLKTTDKRIKSLIRRHKPFHLDIDGDVVRVMSNGYIWEHQCSVNQYIRRMS